MQTTLRIRRYNPENPQPAAYFESYDLEVDPSDSVLDGLIKIRETLDDSLTLRCSCRRSDLRVLRDAHQRPRRSGL